VYRLSTDGGIFAAQGQPAGEGAIGVVLKDEDGQRVAQISERIGWVDDHHVAEYRALIEGLQLAIKHKTGQIRVFLDSSVVANQVNGDWEVGAIHLQPLHAAVRALVEEFVDIKVCWVPRDMNKEADALASEPLRALRSTRG
jgi:ribonuclease HI